NVSNTTCFSALQILAWDNKFCRGQMISRSNKTK
ncbi:MAG: hypothetical protein ACI945_002047, partial [Pseudohongiellaceae bacterium]